jgi:hypothetical protein
MMPFPEILNRYFVRDFVRQMPQNHESRYYSDFLSGERGIRTPGPVTVSGFQDRRNRPLCHLSAAKVIIQNDLQNLFSFFGTYFSPLYFNISINAHFSTFESIK